MERFVCFPCVGVGFLRVPPPSKIGMLDLLDLLPLIKVLAELKSVPGRRAVAAHCSSGVG